MKKEDLKAAIKANFENNEFATAMELNKDLFQEYEIVAGKRSLTALVGYYCKKAEATEFVEPEENLVPVEEVTITNEEVGMVEDILPVDELKEEEEPEYKFDFNEELFAIIDVDEISDLLDKCNRTLYRYCIVKEYFHQVSDTERKISTTMLVKSDGFGWESFGEVIKALGGKKGKVIRTAGSFSKSDCGIPVGEEITKWTIYRIGEALNKYVFRHNDSAIRIVIPCL